MNEENCKGLSIGLQELKEKGEIYGYLKGQIKGQINK